MRRDRTVNNHGGVCIYIKNSTFKYKHLEKLTCCEDHEILWLYLRPNRLPRGVSCLIVAVVYHPPGTDHDSIRDHLFRSIALAETSFPNCGLIVTGDFNRLNVKGLQKHFRLKQIVKSPTRRDVILDYVLTNIYDYYNTVQSLPPFGLSDHNTIMVSPMTRVKSSITKKVISRRDQRPSCKAAMGRYLSTLKWPSLFASLECCEDLLHIFQEVILTGLELLMPVKKICVNTTDAPWMTQKLKSLILKRQHAFSKRGANSITFKFFRNAVNRERKICKSRFYESRVQQMKGEKPRAWWKEIKRLSGMQSHAEDLLNQINDEEIENLSMQGKANAINMAFLEPLEEYRLPSPLTRLSLEKQPEFLQVSEERVLRLLLKLNPAKASGPDGISNRLLREYAVFLAIPITRILNASFSEQRLPCLWKLAEISPLPKKKTVENIKKDLRPISLTSCISKVAEDFVVSDYVKPAVLKIIDPHQYGAIPKSSTTFALLSMIHNWSLGTDGNGATVRITLYDYRKAFVLIDHRIL